MLGINAPELHYQGATATTAGKFDVPFGSFLTADGKDLDAGLKQHLAKKLINNACTRHIADGQASFEHFPALAQKRLARKGKNGKPLTPRHMFMMVAKEVFDRYGLLLAYVNGAYEKKERETIPENTRPTFNLQKLQEGQAVSLLIYPNIPSPQILGWSKTSSVKHGRRIKDSGRAQTTCSSPMSFVGSLTRSRAHEPAWIATVQTSAPANSISRHTITRS